MTLPWSLLREVDLCVALLLGEFLDPILLESLVRNLHAVCPLSLGEFPAPTLFYGDFVLCVPFILPPFSWAFCLFLFLECLLCASLALSLFGATLSLPIQLGHFSGAPLVSI